MGRLYFSNSLNIKEQIYILISHSRDNQQWNEKNNIIPWARLSI